MEDLFGGKMDDIDDEELMRELELINASERRAKKKSDAVMKELSVEEDDDALMRELEDIAAEDHVEEKPEPPKRETIRAKTPPRRESIPVQQPQAPPVPKRDPVRIEEPKLEKVAKVEDTDMDMKSKAKNLLLRRREAYALNGRLAVEDGNTKYANECAETVIMFDQALEACEEQDITMDDLSEIPTTPILYKKKQEAEKPGNRTLEQELMARIKAFENTAINHEQKGEISKAKMQRRLQGQLKDALTLHKKGRAIQPEKLPVPLGFVQLAPSSFVHAAASNPNLQVPDSSLQGNKRSRTPSPARSEPSPQMKAEMLKAKALEYKKAALMAKKKGDIPAASKYLQAAKTVEKEAESLNPTPSTSKPILADSLVASDFQLTPSSKLLTNLKHQLEMVMKLRTQFNAIKDVKRTLFYDELIKKCTADLRICHHEVKSGHDPLMKFKITELTLPALEINPGMAADVLELKIVSISNIKMPEGWKAADAQTFVTYDFPFPHDGHQTGKTQIIYKTDSPEFNESIQLKINRKARQLQRICQRMPIKLAVYQRGGFLRSDKLCGEADIQIGAICSQATLHIEQDLLDHRKKTGGMISIEIRLQKPLEEKKMNTTKMYPWIRLVDVNSL